MYLYTAHFVNIDGLQLNVFVYRPLLEYRRFPTKRISIPPTLGISAVPNQPYFYTTHSWSIGGSNKTYLKNTGGVFHPR